MEGEPDFPPGGSGDWREEGSVSLPYIHYCIWRNYFSYDLRYSSKFWGSVCIQICFLNWHIILGKVSIVVNRIFRVILLFAERRLPVEISLLYTDNDSTETTILYFDQSKLANSYIMHQTLIWFFKLQFNIFSHNLSWIIQLCKYYGLTWAYGYHSVLQSTQPCKYI